MENFRTELQGVKERDIRLRQEQATNSGRPKWPFIFCRELLCKVIVTLCQILSVLLILCNAAALAKLSVWLLGR